MRHSTPVRSSKPYANTGLSPQAPRSLVSRSTARRRSMPRSHAPMRSSSARYAVASEVSGSARSPGSSNAPSSSASARPTASAKPAKLAPCVAAPAESLRTRTPRSASPTRRGLGPSPRARCSKSVSNVPIVPASRPPRSLEQLPLDPLDVGALRDDQPWVAVERGREAIEQRPDFARMGRADDERETHAVSVVAGFRRLWCQTQSAEQVSDFSPTPADSACRQDEDVRLKSDTATPATSASDRVWRLPPRAFRPRRSRTDRPLLRRGARR